MTLITSRSQHLGHSVGLGIAGQGGQILGGQASLGGHAGHSFCGGHGWGLGHSTIGQGAGGGHLGGGGHFWHKPADT